MVIASLEGLPTTTPSPHNDQVMAMNEPHQEDENSLGQASVKDISGAGVVDQTTDGTTGKSINRIAANEIHGRPFFVKDDARSSTVEMSSKTINYNLKSSF